MLAVALGASIGAVLRWAAGVWLNGPWQGFPRALFITGFRGGLTTFSAFSGESLLLLQRGQLALLHVAAHVFGSLACVALGFSRARLVLRA